MSDLASSTFIIESANIRVDSRKCYWPRSHECSTGGAQSRAANGLLDARYEVIPDYWTFSSQCSAHAEGSIIFSRRPALCKDCLQIRVFQQLSYNCRGHPFELVPIMVGALTPERCGPFPTVQPGSACDSSGEEGKPDKASFIHTVLLKRSTGAEDVADKHSRLCCCCGMAHEV